ncbi:MAG: DUF349 domain-containing protein, partial [Actinomycetota bacterium]|nr:DUF349 domain-containing protein [Actinomycetota bacterium]
TDEPLRPAQPEPGPVDEVDVTTAAGATAEGEPAEATAGPAAVPSAEPEAPAESEAPATDEEVSLEAILEDLKRREGRSE